MGTPGKRFGGLLGAFLGVVLLATLLGTAGLAAAQPKIGTVDIDPVKHELVVLTDGKGHFIVVRPKVRGDSHLHYGDGKVFHQQRVIGSSSDGARGRFSQTYWSPRSRPQSRGDIQLKEKVWTVTCDKRKVVFNVLPKGKADQLLDTAKFLEPLWRHRAYALARNDSGTYWYVDRLLDAHGGKGFRIWMGQRGSMVRQKLVNVVSDSEGDIFSTKKGNLRLILDRKDAKWVNKKRRTQLTYVPYDRNVYMIYAELGVYVAKLGTPCDDL